MSALLDINALVALAWDSHVHHQAMRTWFFDNYTDGWATCSIVENGFVRVSSNPKVLPHAITAEDARDVLRRMRSVAGHRWMTDDVSICDDDVPPIAGPRQVTDIHLLALARRRGKRLVTFDAGLARVGGDDVVLLRALG